MGQCQLFDFPISSLKLGLTWLMSLSFFLHALTDGPTKGPQREFPRVTFDQMSGHSMGQSGWHLKFTLAQPRWFLPHSLNTCILVYRTFLFKQNLLFLKHLFLNDTLNPNCVWRVSITHHNLEVYIKVNRIVRKKCYYVLDSHCGLLEFLAFGLISILEID